MYVHFWGTRGSLPVSMTAEVVRGKIRRALLESRKQGLKTDQDVEAFLEKLPFSVRGTYGGNTACVEIGGGEETVLCDAGTGLRDFGNAFLKSGRGSGNNPAVFHLFITHVHWDHIQGFPFFVPAYIPGNRIIVYGVHQDLRRCLTRQQESPFFPAPLSSMKGDIRFVTLQEAREYEIAGFKVRAIRQNHPGDSYGYSFGRGGQKVVFSTDAEHKGENNRHAEDIVEFYRDADLLIFDAQYNLLDAIDTKENWGHSSNLTGVELAVRAGVKRLCLFHTEHSYPDEMIEQFHQDTRKYLKIHAESHPLEILAAYDGLLIEL
ncbi:MAG: MBL fold metallo-hydrolase [Syntrophaceae bacterium]|nr:MBL fold metallo-hydrolase [Syntrophaceae bacterium]